MLVVCLCLVVSLWCCIGVFVSCWFISYWFMVILMILIRKMMSVVKVVNVVSLLIGFLV